MKIKKLEELCIFLMVLLCFVFMFPSISHAAVVGKFTLIEGTVDLLKGGNLPAVPAKLNLAVEEKDVIRTKSASRAEITMNDKNILRVAQRSRIDISEYSITDPSKKSVIKLDRGKVEAVVDKKPVGRISVGANASTFEIHTPNAVAGVRGTNFFVAYALNMTVTIVKDGEVFMYQMGAPDRSVSIQPGYRAAVTGNQRPMPPRPVTPAEMNQMQGNFSGSSAQGNQGQGQNNQGGGGTPPSGTTPAIPATPADPGTAPATPATPADPAPDPAPAPTPAPDPAAALPTDPLPGVSDPLGGTGTGGTGGGGGGTTTPIPTTITDIPVVIPITDTVPGTGGQSNPPTGYAGEVAGILSVADLQNDGSFTGTITGTDFIWAGSSSAPAAAQVSGTFTQISTAEPHLWYNNYFASGNQTDSNLVTTDGGAYAGYFSLHETAGSLAGNSYALFLDPSGNIGVMRGNYTGTATDPSFTLSGSLIAAVFGSSPIAPVDFVPSNLVETAYIIPPSGAISGGSLNSMYIVGQEWGVSSALMGGPYVAPVPNDWNMIISLDDGAGFYLEVDHFGTQWSGELLKANSAGYWTDTSRTIPATGIFIGETIGTFNADLWQASSQGVWIETNKFLDMTQSGSGRNALAALNIPAVEVGRVDLSGTIAIDGPATGTDYVSVLMDNVIFFAPSNGQKPGIWATNQISGSYDFSNGSGLNATTILSPSNVVPLTDGDTIDADFQFTQWQGGKWSAKIMNGVGTLNTGSYNGPVNFKGGAAGTVTGTTTGTLTGTGAGINK